MRWKEGDTLHFWMCNTCGNPSEGATRVPPSRCVGYHNGGACPARSWSVWDPDEEPQKCIACRGVYHPATGHILDPEDPSVVLCGPCARDLKDWLKGMMRRRWGKMEFYGSAATSIKPETLAVCPAGCDHRTPLCALPYQHEDGGG